MIDASTFSDITLLDSIDSTNDAAKRRLISGAELPFVIAAREQTKGRGRSGRAWSSKPGNLAVTFYYPFDGSYQDAARLSFAVSLAVYDTLAELTSVDEIGLKWPNDVLLNRRKVCGILLENQGHDASGALQVIIGIGINLTHKPSIEGNWPPTSILAESGWAPDLVLCLSTLIQYMRERLLESSGSGFAKTRLDWLARAVRLGERITVRLPHSELQGTFLNLDESGALVLETPSGIHKVTAGDVFFPKVAGCS